MLSSKKRADNYFFALPLPKRVTESLITWRATTLPADEGILVPQQQLYMVLAWIAQPSASQLTRLHTQVTSLHSPAFRFILNDAGYWPRSGQVWVGCRPAPRELLQLAELLRSRVARVGCPQAAIPFHPHVTLLRQVQTPIRLPRPDFSWSVACQQFMLMKSHYHRGRLTINPEHHYPLYE